MNAFIRHAARFLGTLVVSGLILFTAPAGAGAETAKDKVRFIPQWVPQAQFAGYYVALDKGFYAKRDLQVEIIRGGPKRPPSQLLVNGEAECGTFFLASALTMKADGLEIVNVAQMVQDSSQMLIAKKSAQINSPKDMNGRKVGLWGSEFQLQPNAFFKMHGITVNPIQQSVTVNVFLRGGVDVVSAMWHNEYHTILNSGLNPDELSVFFFKDEKGLNFPEDGIYCQKSFLESNRDAVRRFVNASIEGWQFAFDNEEEALDILMRYVDEAKIATNRVHQKWMLDRIQDLSVGRGQKMGFLRPDDYQRVVGELEKADIVKKAPAYQEFYYNCADD